MASICLSTCPTSTKPLLAPPRTSSSAAAAASSSSSSSSSPVSFVVCKSMFGSGRLVCGDNSWRTRQNSQVVCMAPDEEKLTRRNPLDFPIEWERPKPGRRPDIFPQFSPMKTPIPPPLPYDPPEEDEEEEEEKKKEEEEEDPEKEEEPDKPDKK